MFSNVLVGIDGGPNGRDAVALARQLQETDAKLTLAHVYGGELGVSRAVGTPAGIHSGQQASDELLERERAAAHLDAQLVSVESVSPGRGLHQLAEERGADLLVVGSCRHGAVGRVMLGDDTRAALNGAPCAVAVAPHTYAQRATPIASIGVGYNSSPESDSALAVARELAAARAASVHVLDVVSIPTAAYSGFMTPPIGESIEAMLEDAQGRLAQLPDVQATAIYGIAGEELAAFGDRLDLLVVGSRGYGPVMRLVVGSTSDYLQRHARCALLVLPRSATATPEAQPPASAPNPTVRHPDAQPVAG
jgi:nucleotide-binding universal stress UspA family protein